MCQVVGARHVVLVEGGEALHHLLGLVDLGHVDQTAGPDACEEAVLAAVVGDELRGDAKVRSGLVKVR